jgi:hypothetical protein
VGGTTAGWFREKVPLVLVEVGVGYLLRGHSREISAVALCLARVQVLEMGLLVSRSSKSS